MSITINTLIKSKNNIVGKRPRLEFEMRTVKDLPLSDLIPNHAAQRAIRQAGKRIDMNEEGPVEFEEKTPPCGCLPSMVANILTKICCIGRRRKSGKGELVVLTLFSFQNMICFWTVSLPMKIYIDILMSILHTWTLFMVYSFLLLFLK